MKRAFFWALSVSMTTAGTAWGAGPITKGPWIQHVTSTSAVIRVEVDPPAPLTLELGMSGPSTLTDAARGIVVESREKRALHSIVLRGLDPATRYPFTVRSGGAQRYGAVTTAPREDSGATFRFLIYGDNRTDDASHAAVVRAMETAHADFLINTGDLVESGGSPPQWQTFFDIEAPLTRERPVFSCVGNHELHDGAGIEFVRYFGPASLPASELAPAPAATGQPVADAAAAPVSLEQLSGTFRWSNARFFLVNGMVDYTKGPTRAWLDKALTDSDKEPDLVWRVVVVHHGPWSSGPHGDNPLLHEAKIPQLLREHKVDLVISGHDHIYERGTAAGLAYVVSGGGGAPIYRVKQTEPTSRRYESVRHFIHVSASSVAMQLEATRPDGSMVERCALRKGAGWDCDGAKSEVDAKTGSSGDSASSGQAQSSSKCGCRTTGGDGNGGRQALGFLLMGAVLGAGLLARRSVR